MEEGLSSEHGGELFSNSLEHLLDGGGVTKEGNGHLESLWWDIANSRLDVVWDPFNEVRRVLVLNVEHLLVNFLGGHSSSEHGGGSEVSSVSWVSSGTVRALYCWDPLEVSGAKPVMKKWSLGNGIKLTASFLRSELSCPGNLRQQVTPERAAETRWLRSP